MSTDTDLFRNAYVSAYRFDDEPEGDITVTGELTVAICGPDDGREWKTNHEAETVIRKALAQEDPALLKRLTFDSESGQFFAYAKTNEDALALAGFITAMCLANEQANPETTQQRRDRVLIRFTADDVDSILGRQATKDELRAVAKAAEGSIIAEAFYEAVELVCGIVGSEDDE